MKITVNAEFDLNMDIVKEYFATLSLVDLQWAIRLAAASITYDEIKRVATLKPPTEPNPVMQVCEILRKVADSLEKQANVALEEDKEERHQENQQTADNFNKVTGKDGVRFKGS